MIIDKSIFHHKMTTDVLIIGAGPTGLSLAAQLIRYNIDFIIVEKNPSITRLSKAMGVHARTLEIYDQLDIGSKAVATGRIADNIKILNEGEVKGEFNIGEIGKGLSPHPYSLILEQSKNEELLYEYIQKNGKDVLWNVELVKLFQDASGVTATLLDTTANNEQIAKKIQAKYVVGCDGAKSVVRYNCGIQFEGSTDEHTFFVADAIIDWQMDSNSIYGAIASHFMAFFPMSGENRWRLLGMLPQEALKSDMDTTFDIIEASIKREIKIPMDIKKVEWFSTYKVHSRVVNKFSQGRCFLAGDAAHIHTPAGGQGMNTGIQDSYNLAWKLALVLKSNANPKILDTYNEERLKNAQELIKSTDKTFEIEAGDNPILKFIRTKIFPSIANSVFKIPAFRQFMFNVFSMIRINYSNSSLCDPVAGHFAVLPGERFPYFEIDNVSIYDYLKDPCFHLVHFGKSSLPLSHPLIGEISIELTPAIKKEFGCNKPFSVLVRPDNYISALSRAIDAKFISRYMAGANISL
jgi:2-polyprenyl-6-methoxyphenol hydroxylase-like FAD-dependent oxidoreductase